MALLDITNLSVTYETETGQVRAVDDVSFSVQAGEIFGLVGESGSGKSTLGKAILRLLDANGQITGGQIRFDGQDLSTLSDAEIRDVRWNNIALIPQNAMSGFNPVYTVGSQIIEAIERHQPETPPETAVEEARTLLERVGIDSDRIDDYPHEYSGGMRQRAMIAMAMACDPDLIIADEPTTALDVIVQDEIMGELERVQAELETAMLVISHDVGVVAETCERVGVMYGGKLMEVGNTDDVFGSPANPYTLGLKNSFLDLQGPAADLISIPGEPPTLEDPEPGCRFGSRCPFQVTECTDSHPPLFEVAGADHRSACYRLDDIEQIREQAPKEESWTQ